MEQLQLGSGEMAMKYFALACAGVASLVITGLAYSQATGVPHVLTAGTPAKASEVNANFNALDARITANETAITGLSGGSNGTSLVVRDSMQTPFVTIRDFDTYTNSMQSGEAVGTFDVGGAYEQFYLRFLIDITKDLQFESYNLLYVGTNCTGTAYIQATIFGYPLGLPYATTNDVATKLYTSTASADGAVTTFPSRRNWYDGNCVNSSTAPSFTNYEYFPVTHTIDITASFPKPWDIAAQ